MDNQPRVSVVVPVYNAEKYLKECVDSIINQTLRDIEIIFVDDGSTDASLSILRDYQKDDSRIQIYTQKNQYAGVARNNGMDHATGKYIIFLDADDFFELNMLEEMYEAAEENEAEIAFCGYKTYDNKSKEVLETEYPNRKGVCNSKDLCETLFSDFLEVPWNKLLLKKLVDDSGLRYQNLRSANDVFFNKMVMLIAGKIVFLERAYVYYRVNNDLSLQGLANLKKPCFGDALVAIKKEIDARNLDKVEIKDNFYKWCADVISWKLEDVSGRERKEELYLHCKKTADIIFSRVESSRFVKLNKTICRLIKSSSFEEYLYFECEDLKSVNSTLSKDNAALQYQMGMIEKSSTYRFAKRIAAVLNRIKSY